MALASDNDKVSSSMPYLALFAARLAAASSLLVFGIDIGSARTASLGGIIGLVVTDFLFEVESCSSSFLVEILTG